MHSNAVENKASGGGKKCIKPTLSLLLYFPVPFFCPIKVIAGDKCDECHDNFNCNIYAISSNPLLRQKRTSREIFASDNGAFTVF